MEEAKGNPAPKSPIVSRVVLQIGHVQARLDNLQVLSQTAILVQDRNEGLESAENQVEG